MICKICGNENNFIFNSLVLNKYQVDYYKCPKCEFIQTEKPFWLDEAYNNAITDLDVGLVSRNLIYSNILDEIIKNNFNCKKKFLDYAGGYGLFVRLMRDKGFDFYREDKYCENIFAKNYDIEDFNIKNKFEIVTAFEVFEHLEYPLKEIEEMFKYSNVIIFSTELQPNKEIEHSNDWWYFTPGTGQHIAFYTEKTLKYIAEKLNCFFYSNGNLHMFSNKEFKNNPLLVKKLDNITQVIEINSLIQNDFEFAKNVTSKVNEIKKDIINNKSNGNDYLLNKFSITKIQLDSTETELNSTKIQLESTNTELNSTKIQLDSTETELNSTKIQLDSTETELNSTKIQLDSRVSELESIYYSRGWKLVIFLRRVADFLIPRESLRRKIISFLYNFSKRTVKFILKIKGIFFGLFLGIKYHFIKFKKIKKRKINLKSKKIVFIDHSFHTKTKSSKFIVDYLKEFFDVKIILDESWNGKPFLDLSFIDNSYFGVVFWQLIPDFKILNKINNDNKIFFPMNDQSGRLGLDYWDNYRDLKIINFCKALHTKLKKWGLDSMYVQYFPKPDEFIPGEKNKIFFWQRLTYININTITKLFKKSDVDIHLHKAVDPGQEFIKPSKNIEDNFKITYSDWFKTREEMWGLIKEKGIYITPREYEGIGMSFLEAMAMGKAVVAIDNPTMNEYIKDGENGYLFDLKHPKEIDLSNIEQVQKKCYDFMCNGYEKWENEKVKIINFIYEK